VGCFGCSFLEGLYCLYTVFVTLESCFSGSFVGMCIFCIRNVCWVREWVVLVVNLLGSVYFV
jgi:hypothetical protein